MVTGFVRLLECRHEHGSNNKDIIREVNLGIRKTRIHLCWLGTISCLIKVQRDD